MDESITAYRKAHDLMWDTRSIIVRFRRQRGNTCLPGETRSNPKKGSKDEPVKDAGAVNVKDKQTSEKSKNCKPTSEERLQSKSTEKSVTTESSDSGITESLTTVTSSIAHTKSDQQQKVNFFNTCNSNIKKNIEFSLICS